MVTATSKNPSNQSRFHEDGRNRMMSWLSFVFSLPPMPGFPADKAGGSACSLAGRLFCLFMQRQCYHLLQASSNAKSICMVAPFPNAFVQVYGMGCLLDKVSSLIAAPRSARYW